MSYRCEDCGTEVEQAGEFGGIPREVVDGRTHGNGQCLEYVKAALGSYKRENAGLRRVGKRLHELFVQARERELAFFEAMNELEHILSGVSVSESTAEETKR
jgi:hypothetical protein